MRITVMNRKCGCGDSQLRRGKARQVPPTRSRLVACLVLVALGAERLDKSGSVLTLQ